MNFAIRDDWRAEDDARTLENAEEIKRDKLRYDRAIRAAKFLVEKREKNLDALKKIAGRSSNKIDKNKNNHSDYGQAIFQNSIDNARR